jgi:hypothetical protein
VPRRNPEGGRKRQAVLLVYRDVSLYTEGAVHDRRPNPIYRRVDEKPGAQTLGLTAPDLPPAPGKAAPWARLRVWGHGGVLIRAGLAFPSGPIFAHAQKRRRVEFIALLKEIDASYSPAIRRLFRRRRWPFLATRPGRFQ